jgi:hypothetical protein
VYAGKDPVGHRRRYLTEIMPTDAPDVDDLAAKAAVDCQVLLLPGVQ